MFQQGNDGSTTEAVTEIDDPSSFITQDSCEISKTASLHRSVSFFETDVFDNLNILLSKFSPPVFSTLQ